MDYIRRKKSYVARNDNVQVSMDGTTVWVHSSIDGSTVGRFSKRFGMDVHATVSAQMEGANQCLHCTHGKAGHADWLEFCQLIEHHYAIKIDRSVLPFD